MNKKIWLLDGLMFLLFIASFLWTSYNNVVFYVRFGSLYLAMAIVGYQFITYIYHRLLSRTEEDKKIIILGITRTLTLSVFLIALSISEISYVKAYETYEQSFCQYFDSYGNLLYNSQYPGSYPNFEVLEQNANFIKINVTETVDDFHFDNYHSNIQGKPIGEIDLTFSSNTDIEVTYDDEKIENMKITRTVLRYSNLDAKEVFSTKQTYSTDTTYRYLEHSVIIEEERYETDSGREMNFDYTSNHIEELEYFGTSKLASYKRVIDGEDRITISQTFNNIYDGALPTMYIALIDVEETNNGYIFHTTHRRDDNSRTTLEITDETLRLSDELYTNEYVDGERQINYTVWEYSKGEYGFQKERSVIDEKLSETNDYRSRTTSRITNVGDVYYDRTDLMSAYKIVDTSYGFKVELYEKNFNHVTFNTSSTGLYYEAGITQQDYYSRYFWSGNLIDPPIFPYIPFFHEYY